MGILAPTLRPQTGIRNLQEMRCWALVLDAITRQELGRASDFAAQRLKALERASLDGNWNLAQYLDLTPSDKATLLDRTEEVKMRREAAQDRKYGM
eukprot:1521181-Amphidinium_carterae.1